MEKITEVSYRMNRVHRNSDAVWRVSIIVRHHHDTIIIPTDIYATDIELTKNRKLAGVGLITRCRSLMRKYQRRLRQLRLETYDLDTKTIAAILRGDKNVDIDFLWFYRIWVQQLDGSTKSGYICIYKRFCRFLGCEQLPANNMSVELLRRFERSLSDMPATRRGYVCRLKHVFNEMRQVYNDSDDGIPVIKRTLEGFRYVYKETQPRERTPLTVGQLLAIASIPDEGQRDSLRDLMRDMFVISFMTMGMQVWDIYDCEYDKDGNIVFERANVRNVRADRGFTRIKPHPLLLPYLEKYADKMSRRKEHRKVFCFHRRFKAPKVMANAVKHHFHRVGEYIGVPQLTFNDARRSMISIALHEVGISNDCILEMQNLSVKEYRITDCYIQVKVNDIQDENRRLIDYVFGGGWKKSVRSSVTKSVGGCERSVIVDRIMPLERQEIGLRSIVIPQERHSDGTWTAHIRMSFRGEIIDIPTSVMVKRTQMNSDYEIIDESILQRMQILIADLRKKTDGINTDNISDIQQLLILLANMEDSTEVVEENINMNNETNPDTIRESIQEGKE